jgi:phosphoribosylformylglycinamidine synthase
MKAGIVIFPGINRERDMAIALAQSCGAPPRMLWHKDTDLGGVDLVVIPGGFSFGDYLRCGAMAAHAPIMRAIRDHAARGGYVLGVCNGFQVLTEAGLLPGALQKNGRLRFLCQPVAVRVTSRASVLTSGASVGDELVIPINHFSGSYVCDDATLHELNEADRVVLRYVDNPNGSVDDIAGIANEAGNVVGLMPHPERASSMLLGSEDGLVLLRSLLGAASARAASSAA